MKKLKGLDCILLIDDEEINNYLNLELIKRLQIDTHVEITLNGRLGLDYLTCSGVYSGNKIFPQPGLIILDINMPLMNGWEFLEEYSKLDANQKAKHVLAMLSSSINPDDKNRANSFGELVGFINKPLTLEVLKNIVFKYFPEE